MHYPWWYVPLLTSPMLIAAIAVVHVYVSMYAVGGGLFLAAETSHAYRNNRPNYLDYLKSHAWFFILLTVVFGAITGVGIWWTIGLASPLATEALIHTFVFAWGMEYVFFVLEIVSAFIFYYYWGKLEPRTHQIIGWVYGISAWFSLLIITAITGFMLNPGSWVQTQDFWAGFFNPQTIPQTLARTGGSLLLAALYFYLHAAFTKGKDPELIRYISQRISRPALLGAGLVVIGGIWWYIALPESARAALLAASVLNMMMLAVFGVTLIVTAMIYLGPFRNPGWITPGFAILLFSLGLVGIGTGEFVREATRKPYIIYGVVFSNQIYRAELDEIRASGYLEGGVWTRAYIAEHYPQVMDDQGRIDETQLLDLPEADRLAVGQVLFQYHCNDCHTIDQGLNAISEFTRGWSPEMVHTLVENPHRVRFFMPPFGGTPEEAQLLTEYLLSISKPFPAGLVNGSGE